MHSKANAQISEKRDQKPCFGHGVVKAHPSRLLLAGY
jgi:hypothetical protein